ncbi:hypothetical protein BH11MYX1_BH11MYX1_12800 [soil metagenome]
MRITLVLLLALAANARADCDSRLAQIDARLGREAHRASLWKRGWLAGIVGATAIDLALIPILGDTRDNRIDYGLGAATTIVGIVPLLLLPPRSISDHEAIAAAMASTDDRCLVLRDAENRLAAATDAEAQQHRWYVHVGNIALNAGVAVLFGLFHHWTAGIVNGVGGALVGEAIILTQPDELGDARSWQVAPQVTFHFD